MPASVDGLWGRNRIPELRERWQRIVGVYVPFWMLLVKEASEAGAKDSNPNEVTCVGDGFAPLVRARGCDGLD